MSALVGDVLSGELTPGVCNAAVNAGGKLLKVVEMSFRYGQADPTSGRRSLSLVDPASPPNPKETRIAQLETELAQLRNGHTAQ